MHNLPGTCLALGIIAAGFTLTGDLGWLASRGMRVLQATDVPDHEAPIPVPPAHDQPGTVDLAGPSSRPPSTGPAFVDVTTLPPGARLRVWVMPPPGRPSTEPARCIAFDVVDPAARETLVSELETPQPGRPAVAPAPPRRMIVRGRAPGNAIERGGMLDLEPRGIAGGAGRETIGPVVALDVTR